MEDSTVGRSSLIEVDITKKIIGLSTVTQGSRRFSKPRVARRGVTSSSPLLLLLCVLVLSAVSDFAHGSIDDLPRSRSSNSTSLNSGSRITEAVIQSELPGARSSESFGNQSVKVELTGRQHEPASPPPAHKPAAPPVHHETAESTSEQESSYEDSEAVRQTHSPSKGGAMVNGGGELSANGAPSMMDTGFKEVEVVMEEDIRCNVAFRPVLAEMRADMNIRFSRDATLNYLTLMLPMKLTAAELCRVMLIRGSDQELIEICYSEVPRVDGESANVVLELESRGVLPSELLCDAGATSQCANGAFGCGLCDLPSSMAFIDSLGHIPTSALCKKTVQVDINHNFACIYTAILNAQRNLSQAYIDLNVPSSSVTLIAHDNVDFYLGNPVYEWMDLMGLSC